MLSVGYASGEGQQQGIECTPIKPVTYIHKVGIVTCRMNSLVLDISVSL